MEKNKNRTILIIANARRAGGLSGGDNIYLNFAKHWPHKVKMWDMLNVDFRPFWACYVYRVLLACFCAMFWRGKYDFVYSASDFLMDSLPAAIMKIRGVSRHWVAGFYLFAPKDNLAYQISQAIAYQTIKRYADVVCVTNASMNYAFDYGFIVEVNGGVNLALAGITETHPKIYDAVFCGRIHPSKGIDDLIEIWLTVRMEKPDATLALIGDGDLGVDYIRARGLTEDDGVTFFGFQGDERFCIYKSSKMVLYPAKSHFSMAPVEAMACGCPMLTYDSPIMQNIDPKGTVFAKSVKEYAQNIIELLDDKNDTYTNLSLEAYQWSKDWDWKKKAKQLYEEIEMGLYGV